MLEENYFKVETENNTFVYLCDSQGQMEGFNSSELNTDSNSLLNAFNNIYPKLTSKGIDNIMKCFDDFKHQYLFNWDNISRKDTKRLLRFLSDASDIDWTKNSQIHKSVGNGTIFITKNENSAKIMVNEEEEKASIYINNDRIHDIEIKKEASKLNIYKNYKIHGFSMGRKIIEFCFYCDNFEKHKNGHDLSVFLNVVKDISSSESSSEGSSEDSYKELLHHMFAIRIASKYVNDHKVEVMIKKKENGFADLKINDFNCECKIRMGPLDNPKKLNDKIENQRNEIKQAEENVKEEIVEYDDLTKDRTKENVTNDVVKTFSKKKADVVFIDYTRIDYKNKNGINKSGIGNYILDNVFTKSKEKIELPTLKKNMIIYNLHCMGKDLWYPASYKG